MTNNEFVEHFIRLLDQREEVFNINNYIDDGFQKVCDVVQHGCQRCVWDYTNINEELMYSDHRSWVYFIVENETIVKCGETGNPLGIPEKYGDPVQPIASSKCRFGRLRKGDTTDAYIRDSLYLSIKEGNKVSLWAKKCKVQLITETIGGHQQKVYTSVHKNLEKMYLENFIKNAIRLPQLNKASK